MKINTSRFGDIEVDDAEVVTMADGLIGFPELTGFVLLNHDENSPFKWLQSIQDPTLAFVVISPLAFKPDYMVEVGEDEISLLQLSRAEDAVVSVIVTIPLDPKKMSANLKAPLVFNLKNRLGKQIVLKENQYHTKHFIMDELKRHGEREYHNEIKKSVQQQMPSKNEGAIAK